MPRKTTILIVILAVVTTVLVILAVSNENPQKNLTGTKITPTQVQKTVPGTAIISFNPPTVNAGSQTSMPVDIITDTAKEEINGVQVELLYDPKSITNVKIVPPTDLSLFGPGGTGYTILFNESKPELGRISYAIVASQIQKPIKGVGKIGTLFFQKTAGATASTTFVRFVDKTMITKLGSSQNALKQANPLTITLQAVTTATATPTYNGGTTIQKVTVSPAR